MSYQQLELVTCLTSADYFQVHGKQRANHDVDVNLDFRTVSICTSFTSSIQLLIIKETASSTMRLSGLQRDVLKLYRQCLRAARKKPEVGATPIHTF